MYVLRCLHLIWFFPASWLDAILIRKKPFEERYAHMARWSKRIIKAFHVTYDVTMEAPLPDDAPILFVCNHQSALDMNIIMAGIPIPFSFVSKKENKNVPYVGSWAKTLDIIFFDREDTASAIGMLRESARRLKSNRNLLIFPEGTRSKDGNLLPLQAGSLQPAFMAKAYIIPIVLANSYDYKHVMLHHKTLKVRILKPVSFAEYKPLKADGLAPVLQERMQATLDKAREELLESGK